jgi:anti-sigma factor RsiW
MADSYVVGHLSGVRRAEYEGHLAQCERCALLVEQARAFRDALRSLADDTKAD